MRAAPSLAVALLASAMLVACVRSAPPAASQPVLSSQPFSAAGRQRSWKRTAFRDLNRNARLDPYEDWRLPAADRARDLLGRMTLDEKAGVMMHGSASTLADSQGSGSRYDLATMRRMIVDRHVVAFITRLAGEPRTLAEENNKLQEIAESGRLGIPATISTDPRNAIQSLVGVSVSAGGFSKWPDAIGLAAARDPAITRRFADIARQEYLAVGIRQALSPQIDLVTEPRLPRIAGTFGEDPQLASQLARAYVEGMQHGDAGGDTSGVLAVAKHWVGYGAAEDGWDSHNHYGRYAAYTGDNLPSHIIPFEGAFAAHVSGVMPTYSILRGATFEGEPIEQVGGGFNRFLLTDLLRGRYGFDGVIMSDWLITNDCDAECRDGSPSGTKPDVGGMPWGVRRSRLPSGSPRRLMPASTSSAGWPIRTCWSRRCARAW